MNNPLSSDPGELGGKLSGRDRLKIARAAFAIILGLIIGFGFSGGIPGHPENSIGRIYSGMVHKSPIKDPVLVKATISNNPFVRYEGTTRSGYTSKCSYEVNYNFQGKSYTGEVKDTVDTDRGDSKFYGCTPTGESLMVSISKADPTQVWLSPSISREDRFISLLILLSTLAAINWSGVRVARYLKRVKK